MVSGFITGMAMQPLFLGFFAWFGLIPLLKKLIDNHNLKQDLISAFVWGITYHLTVIHWMALNIGTTPVIAVGTLIFSVIFLTMNPMLIVFIWSLSKKQLWIFPFVWVSVEYIRSFGVMGFPWISLANTQSDYLILIQNVEITGIYGISFWLLLVNTAGFIFFRDREMKSLKMFIPVIIFPWINGFFLLPDIPDTEEDHSNEISVASIQPNIDLLQKWKKGSAEENFQNILKMCEPAINDNVDLLIWPESSISAYPLKRDKKYLEMIQSSLNGHETKLLTGIPHYEREDTGINYYNAAVLIDEKNVSEVYKKIQLVPGAEYIPMSGMIPGIKKLNFGQANFTHGVDPLVYQINNSKFGTVICFESTFPQLVRKFVQNGAEFLVIVVNDGWYERAPEPQQHAKQSIFRAIETRRWVIRCANTGISQVVDPAGNIRHQLLLKKAGSMRAVITPENVITFYTHFGNIFAGLILLCTFSIVLYSTVKRS